MQYEVIADIIKQHEIELIAVYGLIGVMLALVAAWRGKGV